MVALKSNGFKRAFAVFIATILLLGMLPLPGVTAATDHHTSAVTITVRDSEGIAISDASVHYVISGKALEPIDSTKKTDEYGTVEVLSGEEFAEGAYRISATVSHDTYVTVTLSEQSIISADQDFAVTMEKAQPVPTPDTITGVTVTATSEKYTGEEFPAVKISGTQKGDAVTVSVNGAATVLNKDGTNLPKIKDVGSYEVRVDVTREGYADFSQTVTSVISKNTLDIRYEGITEKYDEGKEYAAIKLASDSTLPEVDSITYSLNGGDASADIPMISAVGSYSIHVHAEKVGYEDFDCEYKSEIEPGTIGDYDVEIKPVEELVYNGEKQQLITISGRDKDLFTYSFRVDGDETTYTSETDLLKTDAGSYKVTVTLSRENYADKDVVVNATIAKASQTISFASESYEDGGSATVPFIEKIEETPFDFSAVVESGTKPNVKYSLQYGEADGESENNFASIDENNGKLTITGVGTVTIFAEQAGDSNYESATISFTLSVIPSADAELIRFEKSKVEYVLGTDNGLISDKEASLVPVSSSGIQDKGGITYHWAETSFDENDYGIQLKDNEVTVTDYKKLVSKMEGNGGSVTISVEAKKAEWEMYQEASASYEIIIKFAKSPSGKPYTLKENIDDANVLAEPNGENGWYNTSVIVIPAEKYTLTREINESASGFKEVLLIEDHGDEEKYIYLRNTTGGICAKVLLEGLKIDYGKPDTCAVEYSTPSVGGTILRTLSLGFYQSSVEVKFTANDATSGVVSFKWWYIEEGAIGENGEIALDDEHAETVDEVKPVYDKENPAVITGYTATFTLSTEKYKKQMRGIIFAVAVDEAGNESDKPDNVGDDGDDVNGFVLDTINPKVALTYSAPQSEESGTKYYKDGVVFELCVDESNFYSEDVKVYLTENSPSEKVSWDEQDEQDGRHIGTFSVTEEGDYTIQIKYADRSGNPMSLTNETDTPKGTPTSGDYTIPYTLVVDRTAPTISGIEYSTPNAEIGTTGRYYNGSATLTLTFDETNFFPDDVQIKVIREGGKASDASVLWEGSTATITLPAQDGHYTVTADYTDRSGNRMPTFTSDRITIDTTAPTISVGYSNNNLTNEHYFTDAANAKFFKAGREATITIVEHNYDPEKVAISAETDDPEADAPFISAWTSVGDTHTAKVTFLADGNYIFDVSATDIAGNRNRDVDYGNSAAPNEFTIDTNSEMIVIAPSSVAEGKAYIYDDVIIPDITISDDNLEGYEIILKGVQRSNEIDLTEQVNDLIKKEDNLATALLDVFSKKAELDGIYTLTVRSTDLSDNTDEQVIRFTVNRFGSVYEYSDSLMGLIANGGTYNQSISENLSLTVYNASPIVSGNVSVVITRDGRPMESVFTVAETTADADGWYSYLIAIDKSNFAEDGVYRVSVTTTDDAENIVENTDDNSDGDILFYVDSTAPQLTSVSGLEERIVNATELEVSYTVYDTVGLASVQVKVDGKIVDTATDFDDASNYSGKFTISEMSSVQHVSFILIDRAGNVTESDAPGFEVPYTLETDITVSTNLFVRWFANKLLFWGTLSGVAVVAAAACVLVAAKKKKKAHKSS